MAASHNGKKFEHFWTSEELEINNYVQNEVLFNSLKEHYKKRRRNWKVEKHNPQMKPDIKVWNSLKTIGYINWIKSRQRTEKISKNMAESKTIHSAAPCGPIFFKGVSKLL